MKSVFLVFLLLILKAGIGLGITYKNDNLNKGWNELVKDNDIAALQYFASALNESKEKGDTETIAFSYLHLGMATYGSSLSGGMRYALLAMKEFEKMENSDAKRSIAGKEKCNQLISTIKLRQGEYRESIQLSKEVAKFFGIAVDSGGYRGLAFRTLSIAYGKLGKVDSAEYFSNQSLIEHSDNNNLIYLPGALASVATFEIKKGNFSGSRELLDRAIRIADSTMNRQALVNALIVSAEWDVASGKKYVRAEEELTNAMSIAEGLTDRSYMMHVLQSLSELKVSMKDYFSALELHKRSQAILDSINQSERANLEYSLELEFQLNEKDNQLKIAQQEKKISGLTNYILVIVLICILLIGLSVIFFVRRNHKRDRLLLLTKEALIISIEEKKRMNENRMQNELEFKESQLTAMSLRIKEKNEIMSELKDTIDSENEILKGSPLSKIISKDLSHEKDWDDFNKQFENLNRNFYSRLKETYPDISPNDLRICALIKLNLSIKEMAAILNISPDSVKTARYRLRKKLKMTTEENLTGFIMKL